MQVVYTPNKNYLDYLDRQNGHIIFNISEIERIKKSNVCYCLQLETYILEYFYPIHEKLLEETFNLAYTCKCGSCQNHPFRGVKCECKSCGWYKKIFLKTLNHNFLTSLNLFISKIVKFSHLVRDSYNEKTKFVKEFQFCYKGHYSNEWKNNDIKKKWHSEYTSQNTRLFNYLQNYTSDMNSKIKDIIVNYTQPPVNKFNIFDHNNLGQNLFFYLNDGMYFLDYMQFYFQEPEHIHKKYCYNEAKLNLKNIQVLKDILSQELAVGVLEEYFYSLVKKYKITRLVLKIS